MRKVDGPVDINIEFVPWQHGDYDFGGFELAHAFPAVNPDAIPLAGDIHFNDDYHRLWSLGPVASELLLANLGWLS